MRILPARERIARAWKNGGGVTRDVITVPEGAGLDAFDWRVSLAEVASDGPFSLFAGIDRSTAILTGGGFDLAIGAQPSHRLTQDGEPLAYPGDLPASARLIDGPTGDLNVMTRRGRLRHSLRRIDLKQPGAFRTATALLLWQSGAAQVTDSSGSVRPAPLDALILTAGIGDMLDWRVEPEEPVRFWLVEILPGT